MCVFSWPGWITSVTLTRTDVLWRKKPESRGERATLTPRWLCVCMYATSFSVLFVMLAAVWQWGWAATAFPAFDLISRRGNGEWLSTWLSFSSSPASCIASKVHNASAFTDYTRISVTAKRLLLIYYAWCGFFRRWSRSAVAALILYIVSRVKAFFLMLFWSLLFRILCTINCFTEGRLHHLLFTIFLNLKMLS